MSSDLISTDLLRSFFIETEAKNYCSARSEACFEECGDGGKECNDIVLAVMCTSAIDISSIKIAGERVMSPLVASVFCYWDNLLLSVHFYLAT